MNWKKSLIERLGNQCHVCGKNDVEQLDIDFIFGQEYLENQYFRNQEEMCVWFVLHFKEESENLKVICLDCKSKNKEDDNSIPLSKLEDFYFTQKAMDAQEIMRWMDQKAKELLAFLREKSSSFDSGIDVFSFFLDLQSRQIAFKLSDSSLKCNTNHTHISS